MPDTRTREEYIADTTVMLNVALMNVHSQRALLSKLCEDLAKRVTAGPPHWEGPFPGAAPYWTRAAFDIYSNRGPDGIKKLLHLEHPVPRSTITNWLCPVPQSGVKWIQRQVSAQQLARVLEIYCHTCWVSKDEEKTLNRGTYAQGERRRSEMPVAWDRLTGDLWLRYAAVNESLCQHETPISSWATWATHGAG